MKKLILGFISIAMFSCSSDNSSESDSTSTLKLAQSISTDLTTNLITTTNYSYTENHLKKIEIENLQVDLDLLVDYTYEGEIIKKGSLNLSSGFSSSITYNYTDNLITSYINSTDENLYNNSSVFEYNNTGQLINEKIFYEYENELTTYTFEYYNDGNIKKEGIIVRNNAYSRNCISYDNKKNPLYYLYPEAMVKILRLSKNNLLVENHYTYDENKNVLEEKKYTYKYIYNNHGYPTHVTTKLNGNIITKTEYKYQ